MMAQTSDIVTLRHSFMVQRVMFGTHALLAIAFCATPWPWPIRLLLVFITGLSALRIKLLERKLPQIRQLRLEHQGHTAKAWLGSSAGMADETQWQSVSLRRTGFLHPWCTVLIVERERAAPETIVVLPDSCTPEDFRLLRQWLKLGCGVE